MDARPIQRQDLIMFLAFLLVLFQPAHAGTCTKYAFKGFNFQKSARGEDEYLDSEKKVTLQVKCFPPSVKPEDIVETLKKESSIRNTQGDAVYFEFNVRGKYKRVYVIYRRPVIQLTFSTRKRNRPALDATEALVEKYYKKTKVTFTN